MMFHYSCLLMAVPLDMWLCVSVCPGSEASETLEDVYVASVETDRGVREQLRLYDTRGVHDGQDLPKHYYSVADGFVLIYSVDSLDSFKRVEVLKKEIDKSRDKKEVRLPFLELFERYNRSKVFTFTGLKFIKVITYSL